jgi:hypothetical protein
MRISEKCCVSLPCEHQVIGYLFYLVVSGFGFCILKQVYSFEFQVKLLLFALMRGC